MKAPFVTHADMEYVLNKIYTCQNNPKKSSTIKKKKYKASGYSLLNIVHLMLQKLS